MAVLEPAKQKTFLKSRRAKKPANQDAAIQQPADNWARDRQWFFEDRLANVPRWTLAEACIPLLQPMDFQDFAFLAKAAEMTPWEVLPADCAPFNAAVARFLRDPNDDPYTHREWRGDFVRWAIGSGHDTFMPDAMRALADEPHGAPEQPPATQGAAASGKTKPRKPYKPRFDRKAEKRVARFWEDNRFRYQNNLGGFLEDRGDIGRGGVTIPAYVRNAKDLRRLLDRVRHREK